MEADNIQEVYDEINLSENTIYNLNLYLSYLEEHHPDVFREMEEHFEGLPGYSGSLLWRG